MSEKSDNSVWDKLASKGFYYRTDPSRADTSTPTSEEEQKIIDARQESGLKDKFISTAFDIPVSVAAQTGTKIGQTAQTISEGVRSVPGINKVSDGLKSLDNNKILNSLSNGQMPGGEAFTNFLTDPNGRIQRIKDAPWVGKIVGFQSLVASYSIKSIMPESWDKIVDGITNNLTRDLLTEMVDILIDWYKDPKTLCCLIKNLAALGSATREEVFKGINSEDYLGSDYFRTKNILISLKEFIDLMIEILSVDLSKNLDVTFDFGKELSNLLIGIIIAVTEALVSAGKEGWAKKVQEWFKDLNQIDVQCTPLTKLINAISRFMSSDHGLFNVLKRYIDDFARHLKWRMIKSFKEQYINKARDLQFLKFFSDLIQKIIDSMKNFELCVEADYMTTKPSTNNLSSYNDNPNMCPYGVDSRTTDNWVNCPYRTLSNNNVVCRVSEKIPNMNRTSYCNHPEAIGNYFSNQNYDNTESTGSTKDVRNITKTIGDREEVSLVFPTNNEVRNFLVGKMGYNKDSADQVISESSVSNDESKIEMGMDSLSSLGVGDGTGLGGNKDYIDKRTELMSALGDCAKTLQPQTIADLANKLKDIL